MSLSRTDRAEGSSEAVPSERTHAWVRHGLVRSLLAEQHPELASSTLELVDEGWDNVTFRLGADLAVRLPRRELAAELVEERLSRLRLETLNPAWKDALEADECTTPRWLHGDLHSRNVILQDGALAGLIDWGDITAGDPATDLACAWTLMDADGRAVFWETYGADEDQRARAAGWAVNLATAMIDGDDVRHVRIGRTLVERLSA